MTRSMNREVSRIIEAFLIRENAGSIRETQFGTEMDLFQCVDDKKHCIGYLAGKGLDPFKRGTKEPQKIQAELAKAKWSEVKEAPQVGRHWMD